MSREPIPEDLRRFLLTSVPSVPFIEAMLVLRAQPSEPLALSAIAKRLYIPEKTAAEIAQQLIDVGVARRDEQAAMRFAPATAELQAMLDMLASFYRSHLVDVTDLIHSKTARRAQQFADAFKWRKEP